VWFSDFVNNFQFWAFKISAIKNNGEGSKTFGPCSFQIIIVNYGSISVSSRFSIKLEREIKMKNVKMK